VLKEFKTGSVGTVTIVERVYRAEINGQKKIRF
jgi:hypothetical protein